MRGRSLGERGWLPAAGERAGESHRGIFRGVGVGFPPRDPFPESSHPGLPPQQVSISISGRAGRGAFPSQWECRPTLPPPSPTPGTVQAPGFRAPIYIFEN